MKRLMLLVLAPVAVAIAASGCNEIFGLDEGKLTTSTGAGAGGSGGAPCVKSTSATTAPNPVGCEGNVLPRCAEDTYYYFHFMDGNGPATGLSISVCDQMDDSCTNPIQQALTPDAAGNFNLTMPSTFAGYLYVVSTKYKPAIVEIGPQTSVAPSERTINMFSQMGFSSLLALYMVNEDPARGSVGIYALDCDGKLAANVRFALTNIDGETQPFYFQGPLPNKQVTQTDDGGFGGFINVKTPTATLQSFHAGTMDLIGEQTIHVRPGTYTIVSLGPTQKL